MMFVKNFFILSMLISLIFLLILSFSHSTSLSVDYFSFEKSFFSLDMSLWLGYESLVFMFMVSFVTMFVCFFSEMYLEFYNLKKYVFLMLGFFSSMVLLIFSNSPLTFIVGWDLLGISSVFLIIYYPNEVSIYNSIFTMVMNRFGDFFLLLFIISIISDSCIYSFFTLNKFSLIFLIFCIMTKSAQFPLSTWLPLAMSAPTPISTMVHSSTLVTAGVFVLYKFNDLFFFSNMLFFFIYISSISFLSGGMLSCFEVDFKKIIAYSTMSQISMIIFFLSFNLKFFSLFHMLLHAYFKSFLFGCAGLMFFHYFMNQNKFVVSNKNFNTFMSLFLFYNLYMMSGYIYSMSFYSKDFLLEWFFSNFNIMYFFFLIIIGSLFTMLYCKILFSSSFNFNSSMKFFYFKYDNKVFKFYYIYSFLFMLMLLYILNLSTTFFFFTDLIMLIIFLTLFMFMNSIKKIFIFNSSIFSFFFNYMLDNLLIMMNKIIYSSMDQEYLFKSFYFNILYKMKMLKFNNYMKSSLL